MGLLNSIFGNGVKDAGEGVGAVLEGAGEFAKDIRSAITGEIDAEKKAELELKAMELEAAAMMAQSKVNMAEAKHASIFVAGWRPFVGWVCGFALFHHYIFQPYSYWIVAVFYPSRRDILPPDLAMGDLLTLLLAMLGFMGARTLEKTRGVQNNH